MQSHAHCKPSGETDKKPRILKTVSYGSGDKNSLHLTWAHLVEERIRYL